MRFPSLHRVAILVVALLPTLGTGRAEAQEGQVDRLVQEGAALVKEGKFAKAIQRLERADKLSDGTSMPALVGLAMAHNGNGEPEAALAYARKVVASSGNDQLYWLALGELTLALASSTGQLSSELESAFDAIRNLLDDIPAGSLPNRLRQRLCWARGLLPEGEPEGLARSEKVYSRQEVHADGVGLKPPQRIFSPTIAVSREDQRRLGESEEVVIHAVVDVDGCVLGGEIVADSNDVWTEIVWEALRRHVFEPARLDGEPVKAFVTLRFDYPTPFQEKGSSIPTAPPAGP